VPRPIAQDHDDKRAAILRAAARLFADEGYGRASMSKVARVCGISKANIYHYYPSKEALLFDMLDTHLRYLRDRIGNLSFPSSDPNAKVLHMITEVLLAYQGANAEHEVLLNATKALPPEQQKILRQHQSDLIGYGQAILTAITPPSVVADRDKMRAFTMSVFGMLNWHYKWCRDADAQTRQAHAQVIAQLVIGGAPSLS
jgi:AcrR family transcriptional regulator